MPNTSSATKALRQNKKRKQRNKKIKKELKTLAKNAKSLITGKKTEEAKETFRKLQIKLDKAASKKIIKKGTGKRQKSRLAKKIISIGKA
ncbi:MAG: 30S ribosomal protein S20 [Candidatus Omnitrophica bacterium]|nr:30S ribosomal protein S20 [Candidatus Omnitrophota bacterium]